ncbi:NADP-dependent oxidoreductase [Streptomyces sp. CC228A]|uniref:NADP-dependent oxidoreductase n=1 Tax=Streptomyces sp. CC228A TaxID=2898186 RepID=UPI001F346847|nr:NADP-dependent oxidoreductase [Streptomyces sp. CC228A]
MKAIHYRRYGGPEVLEFGELPDPKVGPDKVLVKVRAAAVNPVDWKCQAGYMDTVLDTVFPVVPGWDVSGVVVQPGVSVPEFAVGDEVMGYVREDVLCHGTFAEYVAAPVRTLARKPRGLSFEEAAALPLVGLTAYQVITRALRLREGETLLVHAAAGGVGAMAVQLARHLGADVIGAVRESGVERVQELGARPVVYGDRFVSRVRELAPHGVQAAFDTLGGQSLKDSANVLAPEGRLASIADGDVVGLGGRYVFVRPDAEDLAALAALAEEGVLSVHVARTFPLEEAADAQRANQEGGLQGKVVVTVDRAD